MQIERKMKQQREAHPGWASEIAQLPGCEKLFSCIQCGTARHLSAVHLHGLHAAAHHQSGPGGFSGRSLGVTNDLAVCFLLLCAARCPQKIQLTDVMYSLKREAIKKKLFPKRFPIPVLASEFHKMVAKRGRSSEMWLVMRMALNRIQ